MLGVAVYPDSFIARFRRGARRSNEICAVLALCASACAGRVTAASDAAVAPPALGIRAARVTPWRDGARGAYSLIHDDLCAGADGILEHAVVELRARRLRAGLATVAGNCASAGLAPRLAELAADGFEIVSHSYSHPHITPELAPHEITESKRLLESYTGVPVTFFAFPFDDRNDATIALVGAAGYLGARAGSEAINPPDFTDLLRVDFDTYGTYSRFGAGPESLDRYVDSAVAAGGWALRECHGVADGSWNPVPLDAYRSHLDHMRARIDSGELWMAPPTAVLRYRLARRDCGEPVTAGNRMTFAGSAACRAAGSELTVALDVADSPAELVLRCGSRTVPARRASDGQWLVDVDPTWVCERVAR